MSWPPILDDLKEDMSIPLDDFRDDTRLQAVLDAAVYFTGRIHEGRFDFAGDVLSELPDPETDTVWLGTLRLAGRWHNRRRSPDGLIDMAEMGAGRVPSFDPDIDRLLRIGRHVRPRVG